MAANCIKHLHKGSITLQEPESGVKKATKKTKNSVPGHG